MKCLIIDKMHPGIVEDLISLRLQVDYYPDISDQQLAKTIGNYQGLILRSKIKVDQQILDQAANLKFIARAGAGTDNLDVEEIERRGIHIINAPEGNRDSLAEHTIGLLFSMLNRIHLGFQEVKSRQWKREENRGEELMGKTVGILGYGNMGRAFAERLNSFKVKIIAYDKYRVAEPGDIAKQVSLETLFKETDVLSIHLPLTPETKGWVNEEFIQRFEKPFYLINTARGEIVTLKALKYFLDQKKILGAALDVLENENLSGLNNDELGILNGIIHSNKVLITPHVAGWSNQSYVRINKVLVEKIRKFISGL